MLLLIFIACQDVEKEEQPLNQEQLDTAEEDTGTDEDTGDDVECEPVIYEHNPFVQEIISVEYGEGAGFGQETLPDIIFHAPMGDGDHQGSTDVLSLGMNGEITLGFGGWTITDGEGSDFIVFENPFVGWVEPATVSVSADGENWLSFPCDAETYTGCAGIQPVYSHPDNCIDATDPLLAGGDAFDLATLGISEIRFVRITDSGWSGLGGFDLDAISIVNGNFQAESNQ